MAYENMGRGTILIADDVEINRVILGEIIQDMGYHPVLAADGEEALELVRTYPPLLILTDISMPGMSGYELCRLLKEDEETRNIPVIFISALDELEDIIEGFDLGGGDYITKPFIPEASCRPLEILRYRIPDMGKNTRGGLSTTAECWHRECSYRPGLKKRSQIPL